MNYADKYPNIRNWLHERTIIITSLLGPIALSCSQFLTYVLTC